ncbi:MAG: hypothetical protein H0W63_03855 [Gemmatimonadaceae bacterium]|nr:hypothetical protein [Gemmatimonadaceae bacterium]
MLGRRDAARLVLAGSGYVDDTAQHNLYAKTDLLFPAGHDGECVFHSVSLTVAFKNSLTFYVTPIVDGVALERQYLALPGNAAASKQVITRELAISIPVIEGANGEVGRVSPRGSMFQLLVETLWTVSGAAYLSIENADVEVEVVRESRAPSAQ